MSSRTPAPAPAIFPVTGGYIVATPDATDPRIVRAPLPNGEIIFGRPDYVAAAVRVHRSRESALKTLRPLLLERLQAAWPTHTVFQGWRHDGPGPALYGWWAEAPSGWRIYLGRTLQAACTPRDERDGAAA